MFPRLAAQRSIEEAGVMDDRRRTRWWRICIENVQSSAILDGLFSLKFLFICESHYSSPSSGSKTDTLGSFPTPDVRSALAGSMSV